MGWFVVQPEHVGPLDDEDLLPLDAVGPTAEMRLDRPESVGRSVVGTSIVAPGRRRNDRVSAVAELA